MKLEEIKKAFLKYDGSLFSMAREEKEAYDSLKFSNISEETLKNWRQEKLLYLWEQLKLNGSNDIFNRMYNLSESNHDRENLMIMMDALKKVYYSNPKINACIAETVLGRKDISERSGMVFWAHDLGELEIEKELLVFVSNLLSVQTSDGKLKTRLERLNKKCNSLYDALIR